ncbi:MAG TPA: hypothetical protein VGG74_23565 [Kofleriaceae bacterium]
MSRITIISLVVAVTMCARPAFADDINGAATAFSQAQEAMLAGDPARAADLYELADSLAPSAAALRNAARARLAAKHEAMAATLAAELLRRYPSDQEARQVAEAILSSLSPRLSQLEITCNEPCTLALDARAVNGKAAIHHTFFAQPGARTVAASFDGGRQASKQFDAGPGQTMTISLDAPPLLPKAEAKASAGGIQATTRMDDDHGVARKWILLTGIVTVGLGAGAIVEGVSTLDQRDQIKSAVAAGDGASASSLYNDAKSTQLRTNIFIGAAAAAGIATVVLAFVTNWSPHESAEVSVAPTNGGAAFVFGGHF